MAWLLLQLVGSRRLSSSDQLRLVLEQFDVTLLQMREAEEHRNAELVSLDAYRERKQRKRGIVG